MSRAAADAAAAAASEAAAAEMDDTGMYCAFLAPEGGPTPPAPSPTPPTCSPSEPLDPAKWHGLHDAVSSEDGTVHFPN